MVRIIAAMALAAGGGGCVAFHSNRHLNSPQQNRSARGAALGPAQNQRIAAPSQETRVGTVAMIGRGGKFVLVETLGGGLMPLPEGQDLHCRSGAELTATRTADLRLSRERRQQFTSADVVDGQPHVGDAVFVGGSTAPPGAGAGGIIAPSLLPAEAGGILPPPSGAGGWP